MVDVGFEDTVPRWAKRSIFIGLLAMDFTGFACYSVMGPFFPVEVILAHSILSK